LLGGNSSIPNTDKLEITNYKRQITNKPQIQINEIQNGLFRLLGFGFCLPVRGTQTGNLFVICLPAGKAGDLSFVI